MKMHPLVLAIMIGIAATTQYRPEKLSFFRPYTLTLIPHDNGMVKAPPPIPQPDEFNSPYNVLWCYSLSSCSHMWTKYPDGTVVRNI